MTILSPTPIIAALLTLVVMLQTDASGLYPVILASLASVGSACIALYGQHLIYKRQRKAELDKTGDQSYAELGHVVLELTDKERGRLSEELQRVTVRLEEVHQKEIQFLQEQLRHRGNLEVQARNRTHAALAEVQRCVMTIRAYEEAMRERDVEFQPFPFKTYEEIIGDDKIPTIEDGLGKN
jgi:predicted CopG family antitoxin